MPISDTINAQEVLKTYRGDITLRGNGMDEAERSRINFIRDRWTYMYWGKTKLQTKFQLVKALYEVLLLS